MSELKIKYPMGWGNSRAVREAFLTTYNGTPIHFRFQELMEFDYPDHSGDSDVLELTRSVIKRQTGGEYKHVFLVNGATGGVVITLRAYAKQGFCDCHTRQAPYYVRYPNMISAASLTHLDDTFHIGRNESIILLDVPSNPLAKLNEIENSNGSPVVLDGVYFNNVYMRLKIPTPKHDVLVGSYSKLLGINGLRIGWIATNDDILAERLKTLVSAEYCGLSTSSSEILKSVLKDFDWIMFETQARSRLDYNREQWSKLEKYFGGTPVEPNGMFYYAPMDEACKELMHGAGVFWTSGEDLGTTDQFGRFNLGQDVNLVRRAVADVLNSDKI
jgi:aspartate/methionine/tyrosine aminotransferase